MGSAAGAATGTTSAAGSAGSLGGAAGSTGSALSGASNAGAGVGTAGSMSMMDAVGQSAPASSAGSGFGYDAVPMNSYNPNSPDFSGTGPTIDNAASGDIYGGSDVTVPEKTFGQSIGETMTDFSEGQKQNIGDAWRNKGLNAKTLGYLYQKGNEMLSVGGGGSATPAAPPLPAQITNNYGSPYDQRRYGQRR